MPATSEMADPEPPVPGRLKSLGLDCYLAVRETRFQQRRGQNVRMESAVSRGRREIALIGLLVGAASHVAHRQVCATTSGRLDAQGDEASM